MKDDRISAENIRNRTKPTAAMGNHSIRGGLLFFPRTGLPAWQLGRYTKVEKDGL